MARRPTDQQQKVIDAFQSGKDVLVSAGAGCGKSTTLELIARSVPTRRGLYLAFNRAVADDMAPRLRGTQTTSLNTHRLALAWARADGNEAGRIAAQKTFNAQRFGYREMTNAFKIKPFYEKDGDHAVSLSDTQVYVIAAATLDAFLKDGAPEPVRTHLPHQVGLERSDLGKRFGLMHAALGAHVLPYVKAMWDEFLNPDGRLVSLPHSGYLKLWSIAAPQLDYDFVLLDEAQDCQPAVKHVFDAQKNTQRVVVGDQSQQLYGWNGAVDAMKSFDGIPVALTQSWRFGKAIQDAANVFLDRLDADIRLQGNPRVPSRIQQNAPFDMALTSAVLTRTNAVAMIEVINHLANGQKVHLVGGGKDLKILLENAQKLIRGQRSTHPDFMMFESWAQVQDYVENDPSGSDLAAFVNLVDSHGVDQLSAAVADCVPDEKDAEVTISTVHKVKGREWDQVRLADDFAPLGAPPDEVTREQLMLGYVAVTRPKLLLDPGPISHLFSSSRETQLSLLDEAKQPVDRERVTVSGECVDVPIPAEVYARLRSVRGEATDAWIAEILASVAGPFSL